MKKIKKYYNKYEEIINYLIIGVLTTIVSLAVYYVCTFTFLNANSPIELQTANIISWICSVTFAYLSNRKYVFKSKKKKVWIEGIKFGTSRVATLLLDMFCMFIFVTVFKTNDRIAKIIVQVLVTIGNYIISKFIVFKRKEEK